MFKKFKKPAQDNPLVKVTNDGELSWSCPLCGAAHQGRIRGGPRGDSCIPCYYNKGPVQPTPPDDPKAREERWQKWAKKYGLDPTLTGRDRYMALQAALAPSKLLRSGGPNLAYMNALIEAVEGGYEREWRREPIRSEEIAAAYRATGRKPKLNPVEAKPLEAPRTEAGADFEEDAA